jgi:hypothetical protein
MSDWTSFNDNEIYLIKQKLQSKFDKALKYVLLLSIPLCFLAPYFPGRRGNGRLIDKMEYDDAIIYFGIIWFISILGITIWNKFKTEKQFNQLRRFLKKEIIISKVLQKKKGFLKNYENKLITQLDNELKVIEIEREFSEKISVHDKIELKIEKNTNTILSIEKNKN